MFEIEFVDFVSCRVIMLKRNIRLIKRIHLRVRHTQNTKRMFDIFLFHFTMLEVFKSRLKTKKALEFFLIKLKICLR